MDTKGLALAQVSVILALLLGFASVGLVAYYIFYPRPAAVTPTEIFSHAYVIVRDEITELPVDNAQVKLTGEYTIVQNTNSNGQCDFVSLPAGTYKVTITKNGYYIAERSGQSFTGTKEYISKSYSILQYGTAELDNGDIGRISGASRNIDNTLENRVVSFVAAVWNSKTNARLTGAKMTITISEIGADNAQFENIKVTTGQTLTTVKEGEKYEVALGDISTQMVTVGFEVGVSKVNVTNNKLTITITVDDTPSVTDDTGAASVTKDFSIRVVS